jgi:site-specific DNA-methyltransferase (adenine-specific)
MAKKPNRSIYKSKSKAICGEIVHGDAIEFLRNLPQDSARIVFLDPPFNLGKRYSKTRKMDSMPTEEYRKWLEHVVDESVRVIEPGGTLFLYHVPLWAMRFGAYLDGKLEFRQWIAISMKNGFVRGNRLYPAHYALMMFSKGAPKRFIRPRISPQECRTCGELVKDYGGYKPVIRRKGINLSDVWDDLSPVRHANRKHRTANELPSLLLHRVLTMVGSRGSYFVEPFGGSGSGVIAAVRRGMKFAACDIVNANCVLMKRRLLEFGEIQKRRSKG